MLSQDFLEISKWPLVNYWGVLKLSESKKSTLIPFYSENAGKKNSYTLSIDAKTNKFYRFEEHKIKMSWYLPLFISFLILTRLFPIKYIPLNKGIIFSLMSLFLFIMGLYIGNIIRVIGITNIREININSEEWRYYQKKATHFYPRQLIFTLLMLIIPLVCFVYLYIYPSKWWFFGGIISSVAAGTLLPLLSKTRYLLYKNKLDVNLQEEENSNENITDW